jgi:NAD(P)-dependent dehydrogenase (short-subunit alcohol dehydrogenase family)
MKRKQVVVITGASAGVGRAIARAFAQRGAAIGLIARGRDRLEAAYREVEELGGRGFVVPADVADADQVEAAAAAVEQALGPIDIWVNNAMVSVFSPAYKMTPAEFKRVTEVTYLGYVYGTLVALKRMISRDCGTIVQVGSALAYRGIPLQSAYCAAKHAVQGFTESLRCELLHEGRNIKITMVQLPAMNTPQFRWVKSRLPRKPQPVPPIYQPELAAEAIVWATRHYRRQWYVGGPTAISIAADKFVPGLFDRYLGWQGYDAQQYDGRDDPDRPNNLFEPVAGAHGVHGDFDDRAADWSFQLWLTQHRRWLLVGGALVAGWLVSQRAFSNRGRQSGSLPHSTPQPV